MVEDKPKGNTQNGFKEQWRQRFEYFASRYDDDAGIAGWSDTGLKTRLRFFLKAWNADSSRNFWLDVGCGAGTYSKILLKARKKVLALDYSYPTLIKAREKVETSQDIQWILADATNLPLKKEAVDGVLALGVSQALPDSEDLVAELMQTLTPGGEIWVDGLNRFCIVNLWKKGRRKILGRPDHLRYESPSRLRSLLLSAGAEKAKIIWMPMLPGRWVLFQRWVDRFQILFQIPLVSHVVCHSFLIRAYKKVQNR